MDSTARTDQQLVTFAQAGATVPGASAARLAERLNAWARQRPHEVVGILDYWMSAAGEDGHEHVDR